MPPSGFTTAQADGLTEFLQACWTALRAEGEEASIAPLDALHSEIKNIDAAFGFLAATSLVKPALVMIRGFYELVAARHPVSYSEAETAVEALCAILNAELVTIHIPDAPQLQADSRPT